MSEHVDNETFTLTFAELLKHCETVKLEAVEKVTRQQSASQNWSRFKTWRISDPLMKSCCHTNPDLPSQSLIKRIFFPTSCKFSSAATKWGCDHEKIAIKHYNLIGKIGSSPRYTAHLHTAIMHVQYSSSYMLNMFKIHDDALCQYHVLCNVY